MKDPTSNSAIGDIKYNNVLMSHFNNIHNDIIDLFYIDGDLYTPVEADISDLNIKQIIDDTDKHCDTCNNIDGKDCYRCTVYINGWVLIYTIANIDLIGCNANGAFLFLIVTILTIIDSFGFPVREEGCEINLVPLDACGEYRVRVSYRVDNNKDGGAFIDDEEAPYGDVYRDNGDIDSYAFYGWGDIDDSYDSYRDNAVCDSVND